jgi:hypothetical protein
MSGLSKWWCDLDIVELLLIGCMSLTLIIAGVVGYNELVSDKINIRKDLWYCSEKVDERYNQIMSTGKSAVIIPSTRRV